MISALRCSKCGREIPSGFEHLPCPTCAFEQALQAAGVHPAASASSDDPGPTKPMRENAAALPPHEPEPAPDSGSSGSGIPPRRRNQSYWRYRRWAVAVFVAALAVYGTARLGYTHANIESIITAHGENAAEWYIGQYYGDGVYDSWSVIQVNGNPVDASTEAAAVAQAIRAPEVVFTLESEDGLRDLVVPAIAWPVQWSRLIVGLIVAALGALAFALRPGTRSSTAFAALCVVIATLWTMRSIPYFERNLAERQLYLLFITLLPAAGLGFAITFTALRNVVSRPAFALGGMLAACILILVANGLFWPHMIPLGSLSESMFYVWFLVLLAVVIVSLPYRIWYRLADRPIVASDRSRALLLRTAIGLSFAPPILIALAEMRFDLPRSQFVVSESLVLVFPALMCYAIFRHNLLSVNDFLLESALYGLMAIGIITGYGAVAAAGSALLPDQTEWLRAGFVGAAAIAIVPMHSRVRTVVNRRMNRVAFDPDVLADELDTLLSDAMTIQDFCKVAAVLIGRSANTANLNIILRSPGQRGLTITGISPPDSSVELLSDCQVLMDDLDTGRSLYSVDDVLEAWSNDESRRSSLSALSALNAVWVLPLSVHRQLLGAMLIGSRVDYRNFTLGEIKTFRRLARSLAANILQILNRSAVVTGNRIADRYPACPQRIGRFTVDRVLGEGGMAYVYRGRASDAWAAIKVSNRYVQSKQDLMERFHREGRAMRLLDHPNIVKVLDVGWEGPEPYIATEYLPAGSLHERVKRDGPLEERVALQYAIDIVSGLAAALDRGVIHRDIKPKNLLLTADNRVKIADFGLAHVADASTLTQAGEIFGTPHFMSPEVLDGERGDWLSDQYATGITLFYLLTARFPFESSDRDALRERYSRDVIPDVRTIDPKVSDTTAEIVAQMVHRKKECRFQSYGELRIALSSLIENQRGTGR